jgi:hypothetical protein
MRKFYSVLFLLLCFFSFTNSSFGQTAVTLRENPTVGSSNNALGTLNYHASEYLYFDTEIGATNFTTTPINQIAFEVLNVGSGQTFANVNIYMKDVPAATTTLATGTYSTTGYTLVFTGSIVLTHPGFIPVTLTTPFTRTAGNNLQVLVVRTDNVVHTNFTFNSDYDNTTTPTNTSRRYNNATTAPVENSTSLTASTFRAAIQFRGGITNDLAIYNTYALAKVGQGTQSTAKAFVRNNGTSAVTNAQFTLNVTGANTATVNVTIPSLAAGASGFITFPPFTLTNTGTNTLTVTVPSDQDPLYNSSIFTQQVTTNELSYAVGTTTTSSVNAGAGNEVATKFDVPYGNSIASINVYFGVAGNTFDAIIYNKGVGGPGTAIWSATGLTSTVGLNTIPVAAGTNVNDSFYVSIKQTGAALNLAYEVESPARPDAFYLKSGVNPWFDLSGNPSNTFRLMMGVTMNAALPVQLFSFTGAKDAKGNKLQWITSSESNNRGFELERSADGKNFSSIAFVNTKAENGTSHSSINYSFTDERAGNVTAYYRLKQVDRDGKMTYSSSVVVIKGDKYGFEIASVYPNPAREKVNLVITTGISEKSNIIITDLNGRVVKQMNVGLTAGDNYITLDISSFANGSYLVRLINNRSDIKTTQFIKN